ncbi:transcriptional regulator, ArsR family [Gulbenkiania indica]|uniref:Transcriptional regulator, ArsR family n=2 Tax=Gulbenkiania TaxID=397456 RepID=A0A0K6H8E3_9NEIS|nr:metalloregulator ArsR/SmtB family transcription factor [Gulbenkiania indica]CUA87149.1 transcriptional regulator, ArsR family [Gulbenkiania indica]
MQSSTAVTMLAALAQPSRLAVFRLLVETGPAGLTAGQIGEALSLAPATLSFHLKSLCGAGLAEGVSEGRFIRYCARFEAMNALVGYLTENCCRASPEAGCGRC